MAKERKTGRRERPESLCDESAGRRPPLPPFPTHPSSAELRLPCKDGPPRTSRQPRRRRARRRGAAGRAHSGERARCRRRRPPEARCMTAGRCAAAPGQRTSCPACGGRPPPSASLRQGGEAGGHSRARVAVARKQGDLHKRHTKESPLAPGTCVFSEAGGRPARSSLRPPCPARAHTRSSPAALRWGAGSAARLRQGRPALPGR